MESSMMWRVKRDFSNKPSDVPVREGAFSSVLGGEDLTRLHSKNPNVGELMVYDQIAHTMWDSSFAPYNESGRGSGGGDKPGPRAAK